MTLQTTYQGLRVLDLSTNIAGPFAAMILGDLGADVIKVERPPSGDDTRTLPPRWKGQGTVFLAVNRNKRSVVLDLKTPEGREALLKLVARTDILIESFPPGVGSQLALTYREFRSARPAIIVGSVSAFGAGPVGSKMPGYDALVQAVSGMMSFTGEPGGPTVRLAPSLLDLTTGMWLALAVMAALARVKAGGEGEHIQLALLDSAFALMCHQVLGFLATGAVPVKLGSGAPSAAPYRVFKGTDGEFMVATATDAQFARLCRALEAEHLSKEERFRTVEARLSSRAALDAILAERFAKESVDTWLQRLRAAGISSGRVNDLREALHLEVTKERELFIDPTVGWSDGMPLLRLPIDADGVALHRPPPKLGEHSTEVLKDVGYDAAAIERLTGNRP
jgi:crotonobetainyl-CoA:carnitine CoA-transferase CaiB-like acyl-CoA transferase